MRRKRRKIVCFDASSDKARGDIIEAINAKGDGVRLVLAECREIGGIGFLVFEEK